MTGITKNALSVPFLIFIFHFQSGSPVSYCPSLYFVYKQMSFSACCQLCCQCVASVSLCQYFCFPLSGLCLYFRFWLCFCPFWLCLLDWLSGLWLGLVHGALVFHCLVMFAFTTVTTVQNQQKSRGLTDTSSSCWKMYGIFNKIMGFWRCTEVIGLIFFRYALVSPRVLKSTINNEIKNCPHKIKHRLKVVTTHENLLDLHVAGQSHEDLPDTRACTGVLSDFMWVLLGCCVGF